MDYKADKLRREISRPNGPIVVDVRSKSEFNRAHIPGAIHLPFWAMPFRYKSLEKYRTRSVIVYCEHGPRAVFARQVLQSKGFDKAECLEGHMQAWRKVSFPIDSK